MSTPISPVIRIFSRSVYGNVLTYVHPEQVACRDAIKTLTRRDTLTLDDIRALQTLGVTFQGVADPRSPLAKL